MMNEDRDDLRSVPVKIPAPFEDTLIPLLLQHLNTVCDSVLLTLTIVVLVVALLLRPL